MTTRRRSSAFSRQRAGAVVLCRDDDAAKFKTMTKFNAAKLAGIRGQESKTSRRSGTSYQANRDQYTKDFPLRAAILMRPKSAKKPQVEFAHGRSRRTTPQVRAAVLLETGTLAMFISTGADAGAKNEGTDIADKESNRAGSFTTSRGLG